jgi:mannan endo-1,4-beta-mannosidase
MKKILLLSGTICIAALFCMSCVSSGEAKPKTPKTVTAPASPPEGVIAVNDNTVGTGLNQFEYNPEWNYGPGGGEKYKDDDHYTDKKGAYFQVRFKGTNIKVYGTRDAHHGDATVSLDGGEEVKVTCNN